MRSGVMRQRSCCGFFFQAEDGIRALTVTGVQTCALPILNTTTPEGLGAMLRAYDKATGREVGAVYMPAPQSGSPMTYLHEGQQYLVVAISGAQYAGELLAFRLPRR